MILQIYFVLYHDMNYLHDYNFDGNNKIKNLFITVN